MKTEGEMTAEEKAEEKRTQEFLDKARAFKTTFNSKSGRTVLKELMKTCGVLVTERSLHTEAVQFMEGKRSVFMDILGALGKNEEQILEMLLNTDQTEEDDL